MWIWEAFIELSYSREIGFAGPQPLRLSEICALADELEIKGIEHRLRFVNRIRILDQTFLDPDSNPKLKGKQNE